MIISLNAPPLVPSLKYTPPSFADGVTNVNSDAPLLLVNLLKLIQ